MLRPSCRQQSISVFTALILLGLRARFDIRGGYWLFFFILDDVLHDQGNTAVRRFQGIAGNAQSLIGVASHLRNLVGTQSGSLHESSCGICAVRGEFPVSVIPAPRVRFRVGVALD